MLRVTSLGLNWLTSRMVFIWSPLFRLSLDSIQPPCQNHPSGSTRPSHPWKAIPAYLRSADQHSMLRAGITMCCLAAALATGPINHAHAHAHAQPPEPVAAAAGIEPPAPREAFEAFAAVRERLDGWIYPQVPDYGAQNATVVIRLEGELIGRGSAIGTGCLSQAVDDAMRAAERRLALPGDALKSERLRDLAARMTIALELGGGLVPMPQSELADLPFVLAPGLDGVAVRIGTRVRATAPGLMLAIDQLPASAARSLLASLVDEPLPPEQDIAQLAERTGATVLTFRTIHLAEIEPGTLPMVLHRGGRIVESADMRSRELVSWANSLALHLLRSDEADDGLAALALARYANTARMNETIASRAAERAGAFAAGPDASGPMRALVQHALGEPVGEWQPVAEGGISGAIEAAALAITPGKGEAARARVQQMWEQIEPGRHVALMPFLAWAELDLAQSEERVPAASALRRVRELVWQHQLQEADTGERQRDLVGGIVFTQRRVPVPTAQAALPVAMTARLLGDVRVTPEQELGSEVQNHLRSLRFLRQLTVDAASATLSSRPEAVRGGVRGTLWEQSISSEATALTLIAVCDTLASLEAIAARRKEALGGG